MIFDSQFLFVVNYELQDWNPILNKVVNSAFETRINTLISEYDWKSIDLICAVNTDNIIEISDIVDRDDVLVLAHRYDSKRARKRIIQQINGKFPVNAHWIDNEHSEEEFFSKRINKFIKPTKEEGFYKVQEHKYEA